MILPREKIIQVVYDYYDITTDHIRSNHRFGYNINPKRLACYFLCRYTLLSLHDIGERMGYAYISGHAAVIYHRNKTVELIKTNKYIRMDINIIESKLAEIDKSETDTVFQENDFYTTEEMQRNICI